jgi:hypothetical protein
MEGIEQRMEKGKRKQREEKEEEKQKETFCHRRLD